MYTQNVTINNEVGLHARPASFFIQKANEFKSGIWLEKDERRVNAKSLLGVLSLGIVKGTTITLTFQMDDEPGILSDVLKIIAEYRANILTIHQSIPINGIASLTLSIQVLQTTGDISRMIEQLEGQTSVHHVKILAKE